MAEGFADNMAIAFTGPFAPPIPPMDKEKLGGAMGNLIASFPDLTFNVKKVTPKLNHTGAWAADIVVSGTHTGAPFSPMPGMLPEVDTTGTCVKIGPETFTLWVDESGCFYFKKVVHSVGPGHEGCCALANMPGLLERFQEICDTQYEDGEYLRLNEQKL